MNKFTFFILGIFTLSFVSCQYSENIYLNEDGTGKISLSFDGSQLMELGGDEMTKGEEKTIDSVIVFKDFLEAKKDSISKLSEAEQDKLKRLEPFSMHMKMDPKEKTMVFDLFAQFKQISEVQDMFKTMNDINGLKDSKDDTETDPNNPMSALANSTATELSYSFKNNVFKRKAVIIDKEALRSVTDSLAGMKSMMEGSTYKLNYHFPKKIKSVSNETAQVSEDGKSMTLEFDFMSYLSDPESLNLEIILED